MLMTWKKLLTTKGKIKTLKGAEQETKIVHSTVSKNAPSGRASNENVPHLLRNNGNGKVEQTLKPKPASIVRTRRLMKEYQDILKNSRSNDSIFTVSLVDENICEWIVKLHTIDKDSRLYKEMIQRHISYIELQISFPENFPFSPPFMYVSSPRIENGYIFDGGAICMELLTPKGWTSAYTVDSIIRQFAASLVKGGARLSKSNKRNNFSRKYAKHTFRMLMETHDKYGWVSPPTHHG